MKSERRHELQHNDLAEWAVRTWEAILPYRLSILGVTLLVIVGVVAWEIWRGHSESQAADAWNAVSVPEAVWFPVYESQNYPGAMDKANQNYAGTPAGDWAQVLTADSCLFLGEAQIMGNKEAATNFLNNAVERYEKTMAASMGPMAHERAMFGKARILETAGKLPEATAAYQDLNKEFPQGTYKAIADQRLSQLGKPEAAELYKAVAEYKPNVKKEGDKKAVEKSAAGPGGKAETMKLPDNPDVPPITAPNKPGDSSSGPALTAPKSSGTGTALKAETPKSTAAELPLPITPAPATSATPPAKK
jgi:hypothetical protein